MKHKILSVLLLAVGIICANAQSNTLSVPSVTSTPGKTISLPVNLDNTEEVVAVQFNLTLPDGLSLQCASASLTERGDGLSVTMREVAENKYMAMVYSTTNKVIRGRTGTLITVPLTVASNLSEGSTHNLTLSDVIIGVSDGRNVVTGINSGQLTIAKSPDLEVSDVKTGASTITPGGNVSVNWVVSNIGGTPTASGWSEQVLLVNDKGTAKVLATVYYDGTLGAGGAISRSIDVKVPEILGISGNSRIQVKLTPNSDAGEPAWMRENNTAASASAVNVDKKLILTPQSLDLDEAGGASARLYLARSGDTAADERFDIASDADSRLSVPANITIPKGQSGAYIDLTLSANGKLDDNSGVDISVSGAGYGAVHSAISIKDDTYPALHIESDKDEVTEGESAKFTLRAERTPEEDLEIRLTCDYPLRFVIPAVVLPAGQTATEVTVETKDDKIPDLTKFVTFTASAVGYASATEIIDLLDNDVPGLQLSFSPGAVSESDGPLAVVATLRRTDNIDKHVTVKFTDDSNGNIYYGRQTVEMAPGVEKVTINLGPIDNTTVDGERTYNVSAAVWIASCSCSVSSGASGGIVTVPLTVYDNDGPALSLKSSASVVQEGGEIELTVERNTEASTALNVNVSTDHDDLLDYPATVTIPQGATSAKFKVKTKDNDTNGDSFTAVVTVESQGYSKANAWFMVSDQTLPDAQITDIKASADKVSVGDKVSVTTTVKNSGSYELPELTKIGFYEYSDKTPLAVAYLQAPLAPGESVEICKEITLPYAVGSFKVYAVVNEEQSVRELLYTNNRSNDMEIATLPPFSFSLQTDKKVYKKGESITITGSAAGKDVANKTVEVYVINSGYRHVENVTTDGYGDFSVVYSPYESQLGNFIVGACIPKEGSDVEYTSFDVCGLRRTDPSAIKIENVFGQNYENFFTVRNFGPVAATGVKVSVASKPDNCEVEITCPDRIEPDSDANVGFRIIPSGVSDGKDWENIVLNLETENGSSLKTTLYYYCYYEQGNIEASISKIDATMIQGTPREYPLTLTNTGKGETGKISLSIPSWMSTVTPREIPSLSSGESTDVVLQFNADDNMALNIARTGSIVFNCENGRGLTLPFTIVPVSEQTGTLVVDVCDNYTFYTEEAPHLANARIELKNPYSDRIVASGTSDENGLLSVDLPAGYYSINVTAQSHHSHSDNIYINPGRSDKLTVILPIETITIDWRGEETEVEDEYQIETVVHYETNVPAPVVKITIPKKIDGDNMAIGESVVINMTLTNVGLLTALNNRVILPDNLSEWEFEALAYNEPFDLAPKQSVNVPVRITRVSDRQNLPAKSAAETMVTTFSNCMAAMADGYQDLCGTKLSDNISAENLALKFCATTATATAIMDALSNVGWGSGVGGGPGGGPGGGSSNGGGKYTDNPDPTPSQTFSICDPCDAARAEKLIDTLVGKTWLGMFWDAIDKAIKHYREGKNSSTLRFIVRETGEDITDKVKDLALDGIHEGLGDLVGYAVDVYELVNACDDIEKKSPAKAKASSSHSWNENFDNVALLMIDQLNNIDEMLTYTYGDKIWYNDMDDEKYAFLRYAQQLPDGYVPSREELAAVKPESVTFDHMYAYINHLNGHGDNMPTSESLTELLRKYDDVNAVSIDNGYDDILGYYSTTLDEYAEHFREMSSGNSVCASISLKFSQKMTMTRQAFRGTLTVYNGHETSAMTDVRLYLDVRDNMGRQVTSRQMQINPENLTGFEGELALGGSWSLDSGETGIANILFIPTREAAPTEPCDYTFGGSLAYIDPFTGTEVVRNLYPFTLTVNPSPVLDLTYFMQRDVYGDDPMTEAIEPSEEAEFSLLINNVGFGNANNVKMITRQPQIIDNEKGLMIDFELLSSQLNGEDKTLALGSSVATDFGTIPAKSTSYAQWWFKSSLLGHFTDYNVEATHVTSYGNPDMSLLDNVTIHELIRSIDVNEGGETLKGFMTNDIVDANDTPDMMYLSDGSVMPVSVAPGISIDRVSDTQYALTVSAANNGWNYGCVTDPTYGVVKLAGVVRQSDGRELSLRNFWQTDRTLRDGKEPLYENRIHFVDQFNGAESETYVLTFEPAPELTLEVIAIEGIPDDDTVAKSPIDKVNVVFNKYIDASTFTVDDMALTVQGIKRDLSTVGITTDDNKTFAIDFTEFNKSAGNGYYVLTIQTSDITDVEGFNGKVGKSAGWNMYADGLLTISAMAFPINSGTVSGPRNAQYGETVTLKAEANEGYDFSHWSMYGEEVSRDAEYSVIAVTDMIVSAVFTPKSYNVSVDNEIVGGSIIGCGTGIYRYRDLLSFEAVAENDYEFDHWIVNGENYYESALFLTLTTELNVSAVFNYVGLYFQRLDISAGWNWISHSFSSSLSIDGIMANENICTVSGLEAETVRDSQSGITGNLAELLPHNSYKVEASKATSLELSGYKIWDSVAIGIKAGWNWLGYPLRDEMSVNDALAPTEAETLDVIVGQSGFAQYDGENWTGTLHTLQPGTGYMYHSQSDKDIVYGTTDTAAKNCRNAAPYLLRRNNALVLDIHKYKSVMPVVATLLNVDGTPVDNDEYQLAAFCNSECRGIGSLVNGMFMMNVHGNENDHITFQVTSADSSTSFGTRSSLNFGEKVVGDIFNPHAIVFDSQSGIAGVNCNGNVKVTVEGDMLRIKDIPAERISLVEVYDINGRKLIHETRVSESGIKVSTLNSGIYVVTVNGDNNYTYHKIEIR